MSKRTIIGTAAELTVAADLMRKGHHVFMALDPHSPFDLITYMDDVFTRVEVRTAVERADGSLQPALKANDDCDLYAFVCGGRIEYMLPEDAKTTVRIRNSSPRAS